MINLFKSMVKSLAHSPGKTLMILISVSLGVGVLILASSLSSYFKETMGSQLSTEGTIITVRNGFYGEEGEIELASPPQVDTNITQVIRQGLPGASAVSPVSYFIPFEGFLYEETIWLFRSILGVNEDYADLMSLNMIAGNFFAKGDVDKGNPVLVVSRSAAEMAFGSAEAAIGKTLLSRSLTLQIIGVY